MNTFKPLGEVSINQLKCMRDAGLILPFETFCFMVSPYEAGFGFLTPDGHLRVTFSRAVKSEYGCFIFSELEMGYCKGAIENCLQRGWIEDHGVCLCMYCGYKPKLLEEIKHKCKCFQA